ncbi:amino acid synthesis family protein [Nocardia sp. NPDC050408]|uniref:amino acid synthesis family protein n=1 Tax=Nocardia sp. NPDC050408 TaxID=3364319 RepID=UPI00378A44EF
MNDFEVRAWYTHVEQINSDSGPAVAEPLVKAAVTAVIKNPYAGRYSEDLGDLIAPSAALAIELVARCKAALGGAEAESCGKGAIVGMDGEQEHGVACLTTPFGDAMRNGIGGNGWVTSATKMGTAGTAIDIPLAYKNALFVREFYDAITICVPTGPRANEIAVVAALATRGRVHHRIGGLAKHEAIGDGLR